MFWNLKAEVLKLKNKKILTIYKILSTFKDNGSTNIFHMQ